MANTSTLNPLIGAGIEAGGSIISGVASALTAKANRDWQEQQARLQRQWSSMPEQVARARMAGMNPNLVFGKGSGASSAPAMPGAPSMPTFENPTKGFADSAIRSNQLQIEREVADSTISKQDEEASLANQQAKKIMIQNEYEGQLLKEALTEAEARAKKEGHEEKAAEYRARIAEIEKQFAEDTYDNRIEKFTKELEVLTEQIKTYQNDRNVQNRLAAASEMQAQAAKISAAAASMAAKATSNNQNAQAELNRANAKIARIEGNIRSRTEAIETLGRFTSIIQDFTAKQYFNKAAKAQIDLIEEQIKTAIKNNDWYEVNQLLSVAKDIAITGASIAVARKHGNSSAKGVPANTGSVINGY